MLAHSEYARLLCHPHPGRFANAADAADKAAGYKSFASSITIASLVEAFGFLDEPIRSKIVAHYLPSDLLGSHLQPVNPADLRGPPFASDGQDHDELVRPMMTFLGPVGKSPPHLLRSEPTF